MKDHANLLVEFDRVNEFQILAHMKLGEDDMAICTVAAQLVEDVDSINEFRAVCLSLVQRYLTKITDCEVVGILEDQAKEPQ